MGAVIKISIGLSLTIVAIVSAKRGAMTTTAATIPVGGILTPNENLVSSPTAIAAPDSVATRLSSSALE